jgi:hypothetical protein
MIICSSRLFKTLSYILFEIKIRVALDYFIFSVCFLVWMMYSPSSITPFHVVSAVHGVLINAEPAHRLYIKHLWHVI